MLCINLPFMIGLSFYDSPFHSLDNDRGTNGSIGNYHFHKAIMESFVPQILSMSNQGMVM
jgi:hypothetical protein